MMFFSPSVLSTHRDGREERAGFTTRARLVSGKRRSASSVLSDGVVVIGVRREDVVTDVGVAVV